MSHRSLNPGDYNGIGIDPNVLSGRTLDLHYRYEGRDPAQVTSTVEPSGTIFANLAYDAFGVRTSRNSARTTPDPREQLRASEDSEYAYDPEGQLSFALDARSDEVFGLWKNEFVAEYRLDEAGRYRRTRAWFLAQRSRIDVASGEQTISHIGPAMSRSLTRNTRGAARRVYAPFGQKLFEGGTTSWLPGGLDGFQGSWADPSGSGLMRMGDRWYGPDRVWTAADPEWTEDTYGAFGNNPLSFSDPDGHQPRPGDTVMPPGDYRECPASGCERLENFRRSMDETLRGYDDALGELDAELGGILSFSMRMFMMRQMAQGLGPARLPGYRWGGFGSRPQLPSGGPIRVEGRVTATRPWSGGHAGDPPRGGASPTTPSALQVGGPRILGPGAFQPPGVVIPPGLVVSPGTLREVDRPGAGRPPAGSIPLGSGGFMNGYLDPERGLVYLIPNGRTPFIPVESYEGHASLVNRLRESSDRLRSAIPPMTYEGRGVITHPYVAATPFRDASYAARESTNDLQIKLIGEAYGFCIQQNLPMTTVDTDDRNFFVGRREGGGYHLFWPDPLVPLAFRRDPIP